MSVRKDKFVFDGSLYEKQTDGNLDKVLTAGNSKPEGIITVDKDDSENVTIGTAGLTIENGLLCATFYEDKEV